MNSIERVNYIINQTPQEKPHEIKQFDGLDTILSNKFPMFPTQLDVMADNALLIPEQDVEDRQSMITTTTTITMLTSQVDEHVNLDTIPTCLDQSITTTSSSSNIPSITTTTTSSDELSSSSLSSIQISTNKTNHTNIIQSFEYPQSDKELLQSGWPWNGGIVFDNVVLRYREDFSPVLKGISVSIAPGERIGIVGRTGSGKRY